MKKNNMDRISSNGGASRREFLKTTGAAAAGLVMGGDVANGAEGLVSPREMQQAAAVRTDENVNVVHSVCLACNARCGVRGVVEKGRLVNISGNPYHPYNMNFEAIDYATPVADSLAVSSPVCGKCLDTPNHIYSPYRILKPLKRSGPRGSGRFEPIEWDQLVQEVAQGGKLFEHLGEDREVEGLKDLISDLPIDMEAHELGPKRNGFALLTGRLQSGRKEFIDRFVKAAVGSKNRIGHTDICGLGFRMGNWAFTEKKQVELKADPKSAEYILVFGANIYEALQPGINTYGAMVAKRGSVGDLKFSIADPRATNASAHATDWLPVKPGQDGALAMGIARWIVENDRHNKEFLTSPNIRVAEKRGFGAYANAPNLVICDPEHPNDGKFLRLKDIDPSAGEPGGQDMMVLLPDTQTPVPAEIADNALLDKALTVSDYFGNPIQVKTAFRLLKEGLMAHTLDAYAEFSGVPISKIEKVAADFTSYGTRAAVTPYHGAGNYVSGTYASYAVAVLNALVGSVGMRGGYLTSGGGAGSPKNGLYDLTSFPNRVKGSGVPISREKAAYEKTTEHRRKKLENKTGYPARRPWFPFSRGGLSVEALSGIDQKYPYPCKILFTYLFNPVYSIPGGYRFKETLESADKTPLHVSMDIAVNETNVYADYIVPELSYAEGHYGWLTPHAPAMKFTGVRSPMIEPLTGRTEDGRPFCTETFLIDLAEHAGLPGFGKDAIPGPDKTFYPLHRAEDFYLRAFANIARNARVPDATPEDKAFVEKHYPLSQYKDILPEDQWKKVCFMLARGGVFRPYEEVFDGDRFKYGVQRVAVYNEELATTVNSLTGERFSGTLVYTPPVDAAGRRLEELDADYPFVVVTYKKNLHTQSRSLWCAYAMEVMPENFVEMNAADAGKMGINENDVVRLVSGSRPEGIEGRVRLTHVIRPGCVGISFHYGHTQFGASRLAVKNAASVFQGGEAVTDQEGLIPNPAFGAGLNSNDVARLDSTMADTPMVDVVGGIPDFSNTRVKIVKI